MHAARSIPSPVLGLALGLAMPLALAGAACLLSPPNAVAAERSDIAAPASTAIVMSMFDGRTTIISGRQLLAVAPLPSELLEARRAMQAGYYPDAPCGYGYRCNGYAPNYSPYGHRGGYYRGGYYQGGYYDGPPEIVIGGRDLRFVAIDDPALPGSQMGTEARDHWRILFETTGRLDRNPSADISTAALLAPLRAIDPVTTAGTGNGQLRIEITRRNDRLVTADIQKLLAGLGHDAGPADGLPGRMTRAAVTQFQKSRGIEPTGEITPSLIEAIYRAADATRPPSGRLVATRDGRKLVDEAIAIDEPQAPMGTHVLMLSGKQPQWRLLTLSGRLAEQSPTVFGFASGKDHASAARAALARLHLPPETRATLARQISSGTVLVLSDETVAGVRPQPAAWR